MMFRLLAATLTMLLSAAGLAQAQQGSLSVPVRASEEPSALVVEDAVLYRTSHALVVGIDNYSNGWPRLSMAVQDAGLIAEELKRHGFDVTLKTDLNSAELERALREFFIVKGQDPEARLFLWFAGHGFTQNNEGFIIPADAPRAEAGAEFVLAAMPLRRFGEYLRLARSKHVFAVFDACFAGTIFETQRALPPRAITRATKLPVRQFLTAGDTDQPVFDNGTFRDLFIRALRGEDSADANRDGYVTATEIGLYLSDRVTNLTRTRQTPRYGKLLDKDLDRGDFIFRVAAVTPPPAPAPSAPALTPQSQQGPGSGEPLMVELAFWDAIKNSTNPADYKAYLEAYPQGRFAALARVRAIAPTSPAPATAPAPVVAALPPAPSPPPAAERSAAPPTPQVAALPPAAPAIKLDAVERDFVTARQAIVRETPSTSGRRVTTIAAGKAVVVAGKVAGENWYLIEEQGKPLGYVFGDLLESPAAATARREQAERKAAEDKVRRDAEQAERQRRQDAERRAAEERARREQAQQPQRQQATPPPPPAAPAPQLAARPPQTSIDGRYRAAIPPFNQAGRITATIDIRNGRITGYGETLHMPAVLCRATGAVDAGGNVSDFDIICSGNYNVTAVNFAVKVSGNFGVHPPEDGISGLTRYTPTEGTAGGQVIWRRVGN